MARSKNELVSVKDKATEFKDWLDKRMNLIADVAPRSMNTVRLSRIVLTEFAVRTPKLLDCTKNSVMGCLLQSAVLGLEPGIGGQCWILPFWNKDANALEATFIMGYRGFITLARRNRIITLADAGVVRNGDLFEWQEYPRLLRHKRTADGDASGEVLGAWSAFGIPGETRDKLEFLTLEELEKIRAHSKAPNSPAWKNWRDEMYKAKVTKRNFKYMATEDQLNTAIEVDDAFDINAEQPLPANDEPRDVTIGGQSSEEAEFDELTIEEESPE
jgi:recombination protein RecT